MLFRASAYVMLPLCEGFCILRNRRLFLIFLSFRDWDNRLAGENRHTLHTGHNILAIPALLMIGRRVRPIIVFAR